MAQVSEVTKIRRKVLAEVSRLAFAGKLAENVNDILNTVVTEDGPRYRCCIHKERAVLKDRINMALNQAIGTKLTEAAQSALEGKQVELPVINVLPEACDRCPIDKFLVTDACRNCLAHHCIASCPKKAIMVVQNRAYIDKTKCVECGICKRSCSYGAIIEISRPCERACELKAITAGGDRRAVIDYDKCVACGACQVACPFGAISDPSQVVQLIQALKGRQQIYAILAPSFVGQFGVQAKPGQIVAALRQLGFREVFEAALGADVVVLAETEEFIHAMKTGHPYLTSSCCPAFVAMVEKHLPQQRGYVSTTISPMIAAARMIKEKDPRALVAFIGPCIAKKTEGRQYPALIEFVLTFEEMAAILVGAEINVTKLSAELFCPKGSREGIIFAKAGGVAQAVGDTLAQLLPDRLLKIEHCDGLANCKDLLIKLQQGIIGTNFVEGMACPGGCVGGPGVVTDQRVTARLVEQFAATAEANTARDNKAALQPEWKKFRTSVAS